MLNIPRILVKISNSLDSKGHFSEADYCDSIIKSTLGIEHEKVSLAQDTNPNNVGVQGVNNLIQVVNDKVISRFCYNFEKGLFRPESEWETLKESDSEPWCKMIVSGPAAFYADKEKYYTVAKGNGYEFPGRAKVRQKKSLQTLKAKGKEGKIGLNTFVHQQQSLFMQI